MIAGAGKAAPRRIWFGICSPRPFVIAQAGGFRTVTRVTTYVGVEGAGIINPRSPFAPMPQRCAIGVEHSAGPPKCSKELEQSPSFHSACVTRRLLI